MAETLKHNYTSVPVSVNDTSEEKYFKINKNEAFQE